MKTVLTLVRERFFQYDYLWNTLYTIKYFSMEIDLQQLEVFLSKLQEWKLYHWYISSVVYLRVILYETWPELP